MTDDPRERVETAHIRCNGVTPNQWIIAAVGQHAPAFADWPEVVELAQKILAANEAWLDSQTPTLESLRAKYPDRVMRLDVLRRGVLWLFGRHALCASLQRGRRPRMARHETGGTDRWRLN